MLPHYICLIALILTLYAVSVLSLINLHTAVFDTPTSPTDMSGDIVCRTGESC